MLEGLCPAFEAGTNSFPQNKNQGHIPGQSSPFSW